MASRQKVRFGIIGSAGLIGNYHAGVLTDGAGPYELTALCDIQKARLDAQCARLGLPGTTDAGQLVARDDVDAVIVATPHPLHCAHVTLAVEAGKDVLTEKPLAATPSDAKALLRAINRRRRIGGIHYQQRGRPAVIKAKDMIAGGELGRLLSVRLSGSYYKSDYYYSLGGWRGTWRDEGGGVLINQAPHDIDVMCYLAAEAAPAELVGRWANLYHDNSQVEDVASAAGVFGNGVEFTLNVSVALHADVSRLEVFGSAGAITLTGGDFTRYVRYAADLVEFARTYDGPNPYQGPEVLDQPLPACDEPDGALLHKRFAEAVLTRKKGRLLVPAAEGMWSAQTIYGVFLSGYLGKKVKLPVSAARYDKMLADLIARARPVQRGEADSAEGMAATL